MYRKHVDVYFLLSSSSVKTSDANYKKSKRKKHGKRVFFPFIYQVLCSLFAYECTFEYIFFFSFSWEKKKCMNIIRRKVEKKCSKKKLIIIIIQQGGKRKWKIITTRSLVSSSSSSSSNIHCNEKKKRTKQLKIYFTKHYIRLKTCKFMYIVQYLETQQRLTKYISFVFYPLLLQKKLY